MVKAFVAYDKMSFDQAIALQKKLAGKNVGAKFNDLAARFYAKKVALAGLGSAKFAHVNTFDTDDTVQATAQALHDNGVKAMTVSAYGGREMILAAKKSGIKVFVSVDLPVTTNEESLHLFNRTIEDQMVVGAREAVAGGVDGVICAKDWENRMRAVEGVSRVFITDATQSFKDATHAVASKCDDLVSHVMGAGASEFWADVKLFGDPGLVGITSQAWRKSGAHVMTIHACSGRTAIQAAAKSGMRIYAVTVLTSFDNARCQRIFGRDVDSQVRLFAEEAVKGGAAGVIASAKEVGLLSALPIMLGKEITVPGTRTLGAKLHDHARSATAAEAVKLGATGLVFGREVTGDPMPAEKLDMICGTYVS